MAMNTEDSLREYLRLFVKIPLLGRIGPLARRSTSSPTPRRASRRSSPSASSAYEVRERHYDLVVVDAEAIGPHRRQIGAPRVIRDLVQVGLVRDQTQWMLDILDDPVATGRRRRHDAGGDAGDRDASICSPG